ncbi:MAG: hypothetical protein AAGL24_01855 [Pseudomonadota bacterium]
MKAFLLGMAFLVVISIGAMTVMTQGFDFSAATVYQSDRGSVRLD